MQAAAESLKKCPKCDGYFDSARNGHVYVDGLPNRAQDLACRYREYNRPVVALTDGEITAMRRVLDHGLYPESALREIPEVQRICANHGVDPILVVAYEPESGVFLLRKGSVPVAQETWYRSLPVRSGGFEQGQEIQYLEVSYWDNGKTEVVLVVNGRIRKQWRDRDPAGLQRLIESQGWQKCDFAVGGPARVVN
jgi:hypothetical protein